MGSVFELYSLIPRISVPSIIAEGITPEGLHKLDYYAEQFISGRLVYQRFSPREQYGCSAGGETNVVASLLAGAEDCSDSDVTETLSEFQRERQHGATQESVIEQWAKISGCWIENVNNALAHSFGEEIAEGGEALVFDHGATLIKSIGYIGYERTQGCIWPWEKPYAKKED